MNTTDKTTENRARLLNMTAGGNGQIDTYIERIALDGAPAGAQQYAFIVHMPQRAARGVVSSPLHIRVDSEAAARGLIVATHTGAKPRNPEDNAGDIAAAAERIPITDNGRHVPYSNK